MEDHLRQYILKPVLYHMMRTFFLKKQTKHLSADHTSTYFGLMLYVYILYFNFKLHFAMLVSSSAYRQFLMLHDHLSMYLIFVTTT